MSTSKRTKFDEELGQFTSILAAQVNNEAAVVELHRVTSPAEATAMIRQLSELAKLGYTSDDLERIVKAAERSQIIAFEYGTLRHLGSSRTLREMSEGESA